MISVDNDSKSIQVKLGGVPTNELQWELTYASGGPGGNSFDGETDGATPVIMCPGTTFSPTSPDIISFRQIQSINIYNADVAPQIVTVIYKNNSTSRTLVKVNLGVNYTLGYEDEGGWYTIDDNGARINIEISLTGIAIGDTVVGSTINGILYVDASNTLQELSDGLAGVLSLGNLTLGNNIILSSGDSIYDETLQTQISPDANGISITTNSGVFITAAGSGAVTASLRGVQMDDDQLYAFHETMLVFDSPIYNFAQLTASTVPYLDADKNLVSSAVTPTQLGYLSGATGTTGTTTTNLVYSTAPTLLNPIVGTQAANDNSTKGASTAYVQTAITNMETAYNTIRSCAMDFVATMVAQTAFMLFSPSMTATTCNSGTAVANFPAVIYISSSDYPSVNGLTPKLRIRANLMVNHVAPTGNFTFGLYPITAPASAGGALLRSHTIGTLVAGSNGATQSTPAADTNYTLVGSDFALPADGWYVICIVTTATVATSSVVECQADLQIRYT